MLVLRDRGTSRFREFPKHRNETQNILSGPRHPLLVLDDDPGIRVFLGGRQSLLFQERYVLLDPPLGFIQTVLHRMADSREPFQIRGLKSEKARILGCFDNERVLEIYHGFSSLILLAEIGASNGK